MPSPTPFELGDQQISDALSPYGISPTMDVTAKILAFIPLLLKWNRSVSLTTITDPVEIVGRHFGESMYVSRLLPVDNCRLADVGTGAGFPGLAIKIACPTVQITLVESNKKKCAFLSEAVRTLGLIDVEIRCERFEEIRSDSVEFNIITSRAVGEFKELLDWSTNALTRRGHLILWVGAEDSTRIARTPNWTWQPAVHVPESQRRFILIGRPLDKSL